MNYHRDRRGQVIKSNALLKKPFRLNEPGFQFP
jgi:hypothetical protein